MVVTYSGNWKVTSDYTGSHAIVHSYIIAGEPEHQTATPYDRDALNGNPPSSSISASCSGNGYSPAPGQYVSLAETSDVLLKVKTTYEWVGSGTAPEKLQLALTGRSYAERMGIGGSSDVNDGIGDPVVVTGYDENNVYKTAAGVRYREFSVRSGSVTIQTTLTATTTIGSLGTGRSTATCSFSAPESPWSVKVNSDRDMTYRRVDTPSGIKRIANDLEDDEVTSRGGDGKGYGDSAVSEGNWMNGGERDYGSRFYLHAYGPWDSLMTTYTLNSSAALGPAGTNITDLVCGYSNISDTDCAKKPAKEFTVTGSANDPTKPISDTFVYTMKVHYMAEKEKEVAKFDKDYLYWANKTASASAFSDYDADRWEPSVLVDENNTTPNVLNFKFHRTNTVTSTSGYEKSVNPSLTLNLGPATIVFGGTFKESGTLEVKEESGGEVSYALAVNRRLEVYSCPFGVLTKYLTSRWNDQGYTGDSNEFLISGFRREDRWIERASSDQASLPHIPSTP